MSQEKLRILELLSQGKITAEEALKLINIIDSKSQTIEHTNKNENISKEVNINKEVNISEDRKPLAPQESRQTEDTHIDSDVESESFKLKGPKAPKIKFKFPIKIGFGGNSDAKEKLETNLQIPKDGDPIIEKNTKDLYIDNLSEIDKHDVTVPNINIPPINIPVINIPPIDIPDIKIPDIHIPNIGMDIKIPNIQGPKIALKREVNYLMPQDPRLQKKIHSLIEEGKLNSGMLMGLLPLLPSSYEDCNEILDLLENSQVSAGKLMGLLPLLPSDKEIRGRLFNILKNGGSVNALCGLLPLLPGDKSLRDRIMDLIEASPDKMNNIGGILPFLPSIFQISFI